MGQSIHQKLGEIASERWRTAAREIALMIAAIFAYFLARGAANAEPRAARAHAEVLIDVERWLGMFRERAVQQAVLDSTAIVDVANWVYIFGHWPVIAATFVWLAVKHPGRLRPYRDAIIVSGAVGILVFLLWPVAPPRLMEGYGFVDTVALRSRAYRVLQPAALTDLYASMPSLHVGWNTVMGLALVRESKHAALRVFGVVMPLAMFAAVIVTANHYFIDVFAGVALVAVSLLVASGSAARRSP